MLDPLLDPQLGCEVAFLGDATWFNLCSPLPFHCLKLWGRLLVSAEHTAVLRTGVKPKHFLNYISPRVILGVIECTHPIIMLSNYIVPNPF